MSLPNNIVLAFTYATVTSINNRKYTVSKDWSFTEWQETACVLSSRDGKSFCGIEDQTQSIVLVFFLIKVFFFHPDSEDVKRRERKIEIS